MKYIATLSAIIFCGACHADWDYSSETDPMTSKKAHFARLISEGSMNFSFPYAGTNYARISVRSDSKHGTNVIFAVQKGQFVCSVGGCNVLVRFDDKPPQTFRAVGPEDYSSTMLFLEPEKKFISEALKAKKILIEATYYNEGRNVATFMSDSPLKWPPK